MKKAFVLCSLVMLLASCTITPSVSSISLESSSSNNENSKVSSEDSSEKVASSSESLGEEETLSSEQVSESHSTHISSSEEIYSSEYSSSEEDSSSSELSSEEDYSYSESESLEESSLSEQESESSIIDSSSESTAKEVALESTADYYKLFDPETEVSIELSLSDDVARVMSDYQGGSDYTKYKDFYLPGDFKITIDGTTYTYEDVGVRMKGNTSRHQFVSYNSIDSLVNFKVSFKATFDDDYMLEVPAFEPYYRTWNDEAARKKRKDRNLFGLEKLDLKVVPRNYNDENGTYSCLATEIYAFNAFRDNGIIAPHANISNFKLKNDSSSLDGLMEIIEPIDKQMIKRYFSKDDSKGDLYKCVYKNMGKANFTRTGAVDSNYNRIPDGKIGVEDPFNYYIPLYQLKTNEKTSDFSSMTNLIKAIWSTSYGGAPLSVLEEVLDIDQFLNFSAISYLLGGFDDQRYNYNNFYLYFVPSTGRVIFIPYDWDWCMGDYFGNNVSTLTPFDEYTIDGDTPSGIYYSTFFKTNNNNHNVTYSRVTMQNKYIDYINKGVEQGVLDINRFTDLYEKCFGTRDAIEITRVQSYMETKLSVYNLVD